MIGLGKKYGISKEKMTQGLENANLQRILEILAQKEGSDAELQRRAKEMLLDYEVCSPEEAVGIIIGQLDDTNTKVITRTTGDLVNQNVAVVGPSSSGKTFSFSFNYVLQAVRRRESVIVTDANRDIESKMSKYLLEKGYVVRTLDLWKPEASPWVDKLDVPEVEMADLTPDILAQSDINLELPGDVPCAYFFHFPTLCSRVYPIISRSIELLFDSLIDKAYALPDGKLQVPVNFLLDDFSSIGIIPGFMPKVMAARKANMHVAMILQSLVQLKKMYPDKWETILSFFWTFVGFGMRGCDLEELLVEHRGENLEAIEGYSSVVELLQSARRTDYKRPHYFMLDSRYGLAAVTPFPYTAHPDAKYL